MKVSIITVCYNSEDTIEDAINSVLDQSYSDIEYIIIDGDSSDGTIDIVNKYKSNISKIVSEPDEGIFHAMNKGIKMATGDIVGILNSDDFYASNKVIERVVSEFRGEDFDCVWGDLEYVDPNDITRVTRYWRSSDYKEGRFKKGWMPPHPTFFVRREVYDKYGVFDREFEKVSADYEIMLRFLERYKVRSSYIPEVLVRMRGGGNSNKNLKQIVIGNWECYRSWEANGLKVSPLIMMLKPLSKIKQFLHV